ncbi:MAG: helix-turn-helix domain-containing protein [Gaiellaceae bacterium]
MASAEGQLSLFEVDALGQPTDAPPRVLPPKRGPASGHVTIPSNQESVSQSRATSAAPRASSTPAALLSPEDVARRCGLSRKAVYRAVARGELRAARILSRLRIDPLDVEAWIRANIVEANGPVPVPARSRLPTSTGLRRLLPES